LYLSHCFHKSHPINTNEKIEKKGEITANRYKPKKNEMMYTKTRPGPDNVAT
jgi:hypothetical protein